MQSNDELATALERAACILQFHFPGSEGSIREAARRLREVERIAVRILHGDTMACDGPAGGKCTCGLDALRRVAGGGR